MSYKVNNHMNLNMIEMKIMISNKYKSKMTRLFMIKKVLDRMNIHSLFKIIKWKIIINSSISNKILLFRVKK